MSDPFENLLENALSSPDLELGHEMRRRLLASAVAAEKPAVENIVRFERPDPEASAGFDWLVGDAPATRPLMRRMTRDAGFLAMLDDERRFLHSLRRSLRKPAAMATETIAKRKLPVWWTAAAAVVALLCGAVFVGQGRGFSRISSNAAGPAVAEQGVAKAEPAVPSVAMHHAVGSTLNPPVTADAASSANGSPAPGLPFAATSEEASGIMHADESDRVTTLVFSLENAAAASVSGPIPLLEDGREEVGGLLAAADSSWNLGGVADSAFHSVPTLASSFEDGRTTVPEPGGALPVMIGLLVLLLHRPARRKVRR